jgi:hypothetical protein
LNAPSSDRGPHGPAASIPAPPGAFNALTFADAQVKDESTPRRAWESCPGTILPTPLVRPSPPLCDAVRHCRRQSRDTVPPTPVQLTRRALERGRRSPRRGDRRLLRARSGLRRYIKLAGPVTSVAIDPVRPSPPSQHHPGHCITISYTVGGRSDKTPPRRPLCALRPPVSRTLEPTYRRRPNGRPLHCRPQSRS